MKEPLDKPNRWKQEKSSSTPSPPFCKTAYIICMSFFTVFCHCCCKKSNIMASKRLKGATTFFFSQQKYMTWLSFFTIICTEYCNSNNAYMLRTQIPNKYYEMKIMPKAQLETPYHDRDPCACIMWEMYYGP